VFPDDTGIITQKATYLTCLDIWRVVKIVIIVNIMNIYVDPWLIDETFSAGHVI
jgi:hypothetical protein